jgi:hypothetical protein
LPADLAKEAIGTLSPDTHLHFTDHPREEFLTMDHHWSQGFCQQGKFAGNSHLTYKFDIARSEKWHTASAKHGFSGDRSDTHYSIEKARQACSQLALTET